MLKLMNLRNLDPRDFARKVEAYFRPQNPIENPELLQGRGKALQQSDRAIAATGRAVFVWGDRGVGKTSLAVASAQKNLPISVHPVPVACDQRSSMLDLVTTLIGDLLGKNPLATDAGLKSSLALGPLSIERTSAPDGWVIKNVNDAARTLEAAVEKWRERFGGYHPVIIIDEFDQLPVEERKYFGDLIKQIGDRRIMLTLVFCGVAESFDDLLAGHESAYRYIEPVHLSRLYLDDTMRILESGGVGLGVPIHPDHQLRAAQISDGFPHFAHLLGSSMMWEWYDDTTLSSRIEPRHFEAGIIRAVTSTEKRLEDLYHSATRKYTGGWDYFLWATADSHDLIQSSNNIWESYCRIVEDAMRIKRSDPTSRLPEIVSTNEKRQDPFDRSRFNSKMYHLKDERHGRVLKGTRAGWYAFRVPMLRGYCRLLAQQHGIKIGTEYGAVLSKSAASTQISGDRASVPHLSAARRRRE